MALKVQASDGVKVGQHAWLLAGRQQRPQAASRRRQCGTGHRSIHPEPPASPCWAVAAAAAAAGCLPPPCLPAPFPAGTDPALSHPPPQVYTVSGGKNIPAWLSDKKKKALRKDEEYRRRIELIQDFEFPAGCQRIKVTPDGQHIFASGYHPPQARPYLAACGCLLAVPRRRICPAARHSAVLLSFLLPPPFLPPSSPSLLTLRPCRCGATTCPSCP